ncbi:MAG: NADH-quinone oxidoreductase subunit NuoE [Thermodesulfovibrionales bacterium]|nr:NADH-quinone oxidoreductase subunit NuoE [Thermodesulfovibrionales bacterium]
MSFEAKVQEIVKRYPHKEARLLPTLYLAQKEFGWLSNEAIERVSEMLNIPKATVKGSATFYHMFRHKPLGRHVIQLCTNVSCMIMGAERLVEFLQSRFGIKPNSTTEDGRFSLMIMECIGACGTAPAMLVDTDFYDNLTEDRIVEILERYQ